ncbi:ethanolamine ammonia-lyase reactivating factor EutA [Neobacillus terrae]|uniref:ethanolamine ammonia-lyase reactivating factor EutA n=1 Tax=Neobacillus terrae TaxID=3034837 RepID=UPI00140A75C6|nr:ethanolamine ammonia-lyase reactivating factor EutA [Neobacillus terrae]NHM33437.1 ethanolamine ammonia-lyase reactivating factor EutA [Neobacillus terrae]
MERNEQIISAGIDIGTSTTKLILSRFTLMNTAGSSHVPRIEIIDKEIIYKSSIYRTPLLNETLIDMKSVLGLVEQEYKKAGVRPQDIQTGAVIITGETATKQNAEEMLHLLSEQAGEFLVATAGPDLEGIIAGKGSGAFQRSKETGQTIANIDIGGGTANIAVYQAGLLRGTCTLNIGGRLIEFDNDRVKNISPPVRKLLMQLGITLATGDGVSFDFIRPVTEAMARILVHILQRKMTRDDEVLLLGHPPDWKVPIDQIMFSGGVSECIYGHEPSSDSYADIGVHLAKALQDNPELQDWEWIPPAETVRATVLGAGTQTTHISGATIQVDPARLPLKNLPVYQIGMDRNLEDGSQKVKNAIQQAIQVYDPALEGKNFVLYLTDLPFLRFRDVQQLGNWLIDAYRLQPNQTNPIVIVLQDDLAKVLGQTLLAMQSDRDVICIDQILVEQGDYLDIGNKLQSEVVPVVIKTLAFHS